jgi:hypothetical protein
MNASRKRKITYLLIIVVLFTTQVFVGDRLHQQAKAERLTQESLGKVDPVSGTAQLVCFGFRGVAVTFLWNDVMDLNKRERWFEIKPVLNSITLLQPNFHSPWQYQAWNMAYNIANAWEAVKDQYYWISEGTKFMKEACAKNRGVSDLEWYTGFMYFNRFSVHDNHKFFRERFKKEFAENHDPDFTQNQRGRADPFINAYEWFDLANQSVKDSGKPPKRMGITPFLSHPAKALTTFAEYLGKEGTFGVDAREAWSQAYNEWLKFGREWGVAHKEGVGERDQFVHRLEYDAAEYEKLSDDTKYWIDRYGNIVRYAYWKRRVKAEGTPQMESAREAFYYAEKAREEGDYDLAIKKYEEGFPKFRSVFEVPEFVQLREDIPIQDDAGEWERNYLRLLTNLSRKLPERRPFQGLFGPAFDDAATTEADLGAPRSQNPNLPAPTTAPAAKTPPTKTP